MPPFALWPRSKLLFDDVDESELFGNVCFLFTLDADLVTGMGDEFLALKLVFLPPMRVLMSNLSARLPSGGACWGCLRRFWARFSASESTENTLRVLEEEARVELEVDEDADADEED